ncbi:MAG: hypothetical protein EAZ97_10080 [Bacteroidetes bacterium]|nr:MAG: hypothetical protein EAZ97_10080 [Bacteroidota bacterium]
MVDKGFDLFEYYKLTKEKDVLISYKGPITNVIFAELSRDIRSKFDPHTGRKIFAVFMELIQNIIFYSAEKLQFEDHQECIGSLVITKEPDVCVFSCGNMIEAAYAPELLENCKTINSLNKDELRLHKRQQRIQSSPERSKGAGIGLIQVALTAESPLYVEVREIDQQYSFFTISVKIKK